MRFSFVVIALAAAGCNQIFELRETELVDAFVPPDQDRDGTPDSIDNCIEIANDQSDIDEDGVGDRCDNCPLIANRLQEDIGDSDLIGDACDPHARIAGDCLLFLDTFDDGAALAEHWEVEPPSSVTAGVSVITVAPSDAASTVILRPRDATGTTFAGVSDPQLLGTAQLTTGSVFAMSNLSTGKAGYGCGMQLDASLGLFRPMAQAGSPVSAFAFPGFLATAPVNTRLLLQLIAPHPPDDSRVLCLATYGLAPGAASWMPASGYGPGPGAPGIAVRGDTLVLDAFALYQSTSSPCPTTQYH